MFAPTASKLSSNFAILLLLSACSNSQVEFKKNMIGTVHLPPREPLSSTEAIQQWEDAITQDQPLVPVAIRIAEDSRLRPLFSWSQFWSATIGHAPSFRSGARLQILDPLLSASCRDLESLSAAARFLELTASNEKMSAWQRLLQNSECKTAKISLAEWRKLAAEYQAIANPEHARLASDVVVALALRAPYARDLFDASSRGLWLKLLTHVSGEERTYELMEFVRTHGDEKLVRSSRGRILEALKNSQEMENLIQRTGLDRARRVIVQALRDASVERKAIATNARQTTQSLETMILNWERGAKDLQTAPEEAYAGYRNLLWFLTDLREQVPAAAAVLLSAYATLQESFSRWVELRDGNLEFLLTHPLVNTIDREWFLLQSHPELWSRLSDREFIWDELTLQRSLLWKTPSVQNQAAFCAVLEKSGIQPERALWQSLLPDEQRGLVLTALNHPVCLSIEGNAQSAHETLDYRGSKPTHARGWSINSVIRLPAVDVTLPISTSALPFFDLSARVRPLQDRAAPLHHISEHALALPFAVGFLADGVVQFFPVSLGLRPATDFNQRATVVNDAPLAQGMSGGKLTLVREKGAFAPLATVPFQSSGGPGQSYSGVVQGGRGAEVRLDSERLFVLVNQLQDQDLFKRSAVEIKVLASPTRQSVCGLRENALVQAAQSSPRETTLPEGIVQAGALYLHETLLRGQWQSDPQVFGALKDFCQTEQIHVTADLWLRSCLTQVLADRVQTHLDAFCASSDFSFANIQSVTFAQGKDSPGIPEGSQGAPGKVRIEEQR